MKIAVDTGKCMGHARCNAVAPDAFDLDDDGYVLVTERAIRVQADDLRNAAASCPEQAISVEP